MEKSCPICLDVIGETNCCVTACNHSFCLSCLSISLQNKISCPLCRNEIVPESKKITELKEEIEKQCKEITEQTNTADYFFDYFTKELKLLAYRYTDGPLKGPTEWAKNINPCVFCGCKSELDEYGDRICYCDYCSKNGCADENTRWMSPWKEKNLR